MCLCGPLISLSTKTRNFIIVRITYLIGKSIHINRNVSRNTNSIFNYSHVLYITQTIWAFVPLHILLFPQNDATESNYGLTKLHLRFDIIKAFMLDVLTSTMC